jgi:hypothetical protein
MQYRYIATMQVRPRGAIGVFDTVEFPVVLPDARASVMQVFSAWYALLGDEFEPGHVVRINGQFTCGMDDYGFSGEEVDHGM